MKNNIFIILLGVLLTLLNPSTIFAATLYSNDFTTSYTGFKTDFGICSTTVNGLTCNLAASTYLTKLPMLQCVSGDFTTTNTSSKNALLILETNKDLGDLIDIVFQPNTNIILNYTKDDVIGKGGRWDTGVITPLGSHNYKLCQNSDLYTVFLDGKLIFSQNISGFDGKYIGFSLASENILTNFLATDAQLPQDDDSSHIIFQDDFNDNDISDWQLVRNEQFHNPSQPCVYNGSRSDWQAVDGRIGIKIDGPACATDIIPADFTLPDNTNYRYSVDVEYPATTVADRRINYKYKSPEEWYTFHSYGSAIAFAKLVNDYDRLEWRNFPFEANKTYHYDIDFIGDKITLYIDNVKIDEFTDTPPTIQGVTTALQAYVGADPDTEVWYDNLVVTRLDSPTDKPTPFLELPWAYGNAHFIQEVFNPNSWFDHKYPLQNVICCTFKVRKYSGGEDKNDAYRSHSGYDYANGIKLHTPVLAAASGTATFTPANKSGGAGNVIKIDHGNGYQTWYEHLDGNDLIVSTEGTFTPVEKGQPIGKVGMTGATNGPHIHFSVFKDENENDSFADDYPVGLVDPLGWEGDYPDPWTEYESNGRHGAASYNLFLAREEPKEQAIPQSTGGTVATDKVKVQINPNTLPVDITVKLKYGPFESTDSLESVVPSIFLNAFNSLGDQINEFVKPVEIEYSYADADLLNINEGTLKLYHYNKATSTWDALPSTLDKTNKKVTAQTRHFSQFALMGEVKDKVAPVTEVVIDGYQNLDGVYRSLVSVELKGEDNQGGVGVSETLYTVNDQDWFTYTQPLVFENGGTYEITYQTIDNAYNLEEIKTVEFQLDLSLITYQSTLKDIKQAKEQGLIRRRLVRSLTALVKNAERIEPRRERVAGLLLEVGIKLLDHEKEKGRVDENAYEILHYDLTTLRNNI